jgi:hypothetical protein
MVVVGVIKGNECSPVIGMFDDSSTIPQRGSPLGPHKFEVKIGNDKATIKVDGRIFIVPRWLARRTLRPSMMQAVGLASGSAFSASSEAVPA